VDVGLCHYSVTSFTPKDWVWWQSTPCAICGRQNGIQFFLQVQYFHPFITVPPTLHTHSFICYWCYIHVILQTEGFIKHPEVNIQCIWNLSYRWDLLVVAVHYGSDGATEVKWYSVKPWETTLTCMCTEIPCCTVFLFYHHKLHHMNSGAILGFDCASHLGTR
jgi:hypothetical protein